MNDPIRTPADALRCALVLAIQAETEERSAQAVEYAEYFTQFVSEEELEQLKREALAIVRFEDGHPSPWLN